MRILIKLTHAATNCHGTALIQFAEPRFRNDSGSVCGGIQQMHAVNKALQAFGAPLSKVNAGDFMAEGKHGFAAAGIRS